MTKNNVDKMINRIESMYETLDAVALSDEARQQIQQCKNIALKMKNELGVA